MVCTEILFFMHGPICLNMLMCILFRSGGKCAKCSAGGLVFILCYILLIIYASTIIQTSVCARATDNAAFL